MCSAIGEIGQILKARVTDTNKAVQLLALDVVGRIATGMGKPFEKHTRIFALPVATVLSDLPKSDGWEPGRMHFTALGVYTTLDPLYVVE